MTGSAAPDRDRAVHWLTAQTVVFGVVAALLAVVANAMFIQAYGAHWLPATYVVIGIAGALVSAGLARAVQRFDLVRIAVVVLGGAAVLFGLAWAATLGGGGAWVSGPLLVVFPLLIQLGFVFVGGQAGRILDIAGIKLRFPRIMAGFAVGATIGGLLAARLVDVLGRSEPVLLVTAIVQLLFAVTVLLTGRRFAALLAVPAGPAAAPGTDHPGETAEGALGLRALVGHPFVRLVLAYQVLAAVVGQLSDYLVFHRAAAQYADAADLARFIAVFTAAINAVAVVFLALLAGPLLRRFGLRFGLGSNPVGLLLGALAMALVLVAGGPATLALLLTASGVRILGIALTDGATRTSLNALYQVLPPRTRLAAQTVVEGMGVPVAITLSGLLILALNALPAALTTLIAATLVLSAAWTWSGVALHRAYGPALVAALRRPRLLRHPGPGAALVATGSADADELVRLAGSTDPREALLGVELLAATAVPVGPELRALADADLPEARLTALHLLAAAGDVDARESLVAEVRAAAGGAAPAFRERAAYACGVLDRHEREATLPGLLADPEPTVRTAALDAVQPGDAGLVDAAVAAVADARTAAAAGRAIRRLGEAAVPVVARALEDSTGPSLTDPGRYAVRLVRAVGSPDAAGGRAHTLLLGWVDHRDRAVGLAALHGLARPEGADSGTTAVLDRVLADDLAHARRIRDALPWAHGPGREALWRALIDDLALLRARVIAALVARHGRDRLGPVATGLSLADGPDPLALEALEVLDGRTAARFSAVFGDPWHAPTVPPQRPGLEAVLADLVDDPAAHWRSSWVRTCALDLLDRVRQGDPS